MLNHGLVRRRQWWPNWHPLSMTEAHMIQNNNNNNTTNYTSYTALLYSIVLVQTQSLFPMPYSKHSKIACILIHAIG